MKTKFSKRILSLFLAVMMVVTSIPMFALTASAAEKDHYLFAYFTGDKNVLSSNTSNQAIRFAVSTDGQSYESVNGGNPVIQQYVGTKNARDPYVFKGQDGMYYCLATDADCDNNSWWGNSSSMVFWRSSDLINWKDATVINMSKIISKYDGSANVYRCWAPQVIWDDTQSQYMVYFGLAADGYANNGTGNNTHMYYCTTTNLLDWESYSKPQPLVINSSKDNIDGDITYYNGNYYLFCKDETNATICVIKSSSINSFDAKNLIKLDSGSSVGALEGCQVFQNNNGEFIYIADRYSNKGKFVAYNFGTDLDAVLNNATVKNNVNTLSISSYIDNTATSSLTALTPRHGSMLKITADQYTALKSAVFSTEVPIDSSLSSPVRPAEKNNGINLSSNLIAQYFVNDTTTDTATGQYGLSAAGSGASWNSASFGAHGAAYFTPDNYMYTGSVSSMLSSVSASNGITFSFYGLPETFDNYGRFFEMNSNGTKGSIVWDSTGNYISTKASRFSTETVEVETVNNNNFTWCDETHPTGGRWAGTASYTASKWNQFTVTINDTHVCLYINGELKFDLTRDNAITSAIIDSFKSGGYLLLGASGYNDPTYVGYMRDFRVYNKAITSDEAAKLYNQYGYDNSYSIAEIRQAIEDYEGIMKTALTNDTVLTNMKPAYDAYVALRKGFDAYYYGGDDTVDIEGLAVSLKLATAAMTNWTHYTGTALPSFADNSGTSASDYTRKNHQYFNNLLYSSTVGEAGHDTGNSIPMTSATADTGLISEARVGFYHGAVALLYTGVSGEEPEFPVMLRAGSTNNKKYLWIAHPCKSASDGSNSDDFNLYGYWNFNLASWGANSARNANWSWTMDNADTYPQYVAPVANDSKHRAKFETGTNGMRRIGAGANSLIFKGTASLGSNAYKEYTLYWHAYTGSSYNKDEKFATSGNKVYVVNYKLLLDAIDTCFAKLENINNYKQGGLSNVLGYIDAATSYNPNSDFTSVSTLSDNVSACGTNISSRVTNLNKFINGEVTPSADRYETEYQALRGAMDKYLNSTDAEYLNPSEYTSDSINAYKAIYTASQAFMKDVYTNGYKYSEVGDNATALLNVLNKPVDKEALVNAADAKRESRIFNEDGTEQIYTYESWSAINDEVVKADKITSTVKGLYETKESDYYTLSDSTTTAVGYDKVDATTNNKTKIDNQTAVLTADSLVLVPVDATDRYQSFDAAYEVANSVDMAKYNAAGVDLITEARAKAYADVYVAAGDNAETYNNATGTHYMTAETLLKITTTGATDTVTTTLLNAINKANAPSEEDDSIYPFVNQYKAVLNGDKVNAQPKYYGDMFSFTVTADADALVTWVVTVYATEADMNAALDEKGTPTPINSQVISTYNGVTIERKADGFIVFESTVEKATDKTTTYAYKIYNAYGNVTDVIYSDTLYNNTTIADQIKTSPKLPFYTFNGWNVGAPDSNNVINVIPNFKINDDDYKTITVNGGTISLNKSTANHALVGAEATITGNEGTYGWAVKLAGGTYEIVAYGKNYKFNVLNSEDYVAITTADGKYYAGEVELTPTNVAGFSNEYTDTTMDDAAYLKAKLDSKAPFVYVQTVDDLTVNETPKKRVYVRVTAGAEENILSYGLELDGQKFNSTAKNDGGQFYLQMNKTTFEAKGSIKAFVNYSFTYTSDAGTSAEISTVDYAVVDKEVQ